MSLSENQIELLTGIQAKIIRGDIGSIAESTGFTREYVSKVLSPTTETFNEDIVEAAVNQITNREHRTDKLLKKISPRT